jgi:hypothetical protein
MPLQDALATYWMSDRVLLEDVNTKEKTEFDLGAFFANPKHDMDLTIF